MEKRLTRGDGNKIKIIIIIKKTKQTQQQQQFLISKSQTRVNLDIKRIHTNNTNNSGKKQIFAFYNKNRKTLKSNVCNKQTSSKIKSSKAAAVSVITIKIGRKIETSKLTPSLLFVLQIK